MAFSVVVKTAEVEALARSLGRLNSTALNSVAQRSVNRALPKIFDESRRRMLSGVNLSDAYVRERMDTEPANDDANTAVVVAFKPGGKRRPGTRPTNLRQYAAVQVQAPVRFSNDDPRIAKNQWGKNPRANGKSLRWKRRTGSASLGIPVGMKQAGVSVAIVSGKREILPHAFFMKTKNGVLVMARKKPRGKGAGKGKARSLYSLSVAQLFRKQLPNIIPFAERQLRDDIATEAQIELDRVFK